MPFTAGIAKNENDLFQRLLQFAGGFDRLGQLVFSGSRLGELRSLYVDPDFYFTRFRLTFVTPTTFTVEMSEDGFSSEWSVDSTVYNVNEAVQILRPDGGGVLINFFYSPYNTYGGSVAAAHGVADEVIIKVMDFTPVGGTNPDCIPSVDLQVGRFLPLDGDPSLVDTGNESYSDRVCLICTSVASNVATFSFGTANRTADLVGGDISRTLTQGVELTEPDDGFVGFRSLVVNMAADPAASYQYVVGDKIYIYFDNCLANNPSRPYLTVTERPNTGEVRADWVTASPTQGRRQIRSYLNFTSSDLWSQKEPAGNLEANVVGLREGDAKMIVFKDTSTYRVNGPYYYAIERRAISASPTTEFVWLLHGMRSIDGFPASDVASFDTVNRYFENAVGRNLSDWDTAANPSVPAFADYHAPCLHIKGTSIRYWIGHDQGSIRLVIQCGDKFLSAYLGFYEPNDWPDAYSQPIFVGGSGSGAAPRLDQPSAYHSNFYDPASDEDGSTSGTGNAPGFDAGWQKKSAAMVWFGNAGFKRLVNRFRNGLGFDTATFNGDKTQSSYRAVYDAVVNVFASLDVARGYTCQNNIHPWFAGGAGKITSESGTPLQLFKNSIGANVGELDEVYAFSSLGNVGSDAGMYKAFDIGVLPVINTYTGDAAKLLRLCTIFPNHNYAANPSQWAAMGFTTYLPL